MGSDCAGINYTGKRACGGFCISVQHPEVGNSEVSGDCHSCAGIHSQQSPRARLQSPNAFERFRLSGSLSCSRPS